MVIRIIIMYTEEEGMALRRLSSLLSDTGSFPDWIDFFALHKDILNMYAKFSVTSNQDDSVIMKSHYFVEREKKC